jgi:hypothetical protein
MFESVGFRFDGVKQFCEMCSFQFFVSNNRQIAMTDSISTVLLSAKYLRRLSKTVCADQAVRVAAAAT